MDRNLTQGPQSKRSMDAARPGGLNSDLHPEAQAPLPTAPPPPPVPFQDFRRDNIKVQGPGFEGIILGRGVDRTRGTILYQVQDAKGVVHEAFEDELEPAGRQRNEIFPDRLDGCTTFEGQYPFTMKLDRQALHSKERQPYLVVEEGPDHEMVCRAAQPTYELALRYYKPSRWIIHPEGAKPGEREREPRLTLVLDNQGNPDHDQDPTRRLPGVPRREIRVRTLEEASAQVRSYIREFNLGGGNCAEFKVLHQGEPVASVSYNGRIWDPSGKRPLSDADLDLDVSEAPEVRQPLDEDWLKSLAQDKRVAGWLTSFDHPRCLGALAEAIRVAKASAWIPEGAARSQEGQGLELQVMDQLKAWAAEWSVFWTRISQGRSCEATGEELARVYEKRRVGLVHSELLRVQQQTALALAINMLHSASGPEAELEMLDSLEAWGRAAPARSLYLANAMNQAERQLLDKAEEDDELAAEVGSAIFEVKDPEAAWDLYDMWRDGEFKPAAERLVPQPDPKG